MLLLSALEQALQRLLAEPRAVIVRALEHFEASLCFGAEGRFAIRTEHSVEPFAHSFEQFCVAPVCPLILARSFGVAKLFPQSIFLVIHQQNPPEVTLSRNFPFTPVATENSKRSERRKLCRQEIAEKDHPCRFQSLAWRHQADRQITA